MNGERERDTFGVDSIRSGEERYSTIKQIEKKDQTDDYLETSLSLSLSLETKIVHLSLCIPKTATMID